MSARRRCSKLIERRNRCEQKKKGDNSSKQLLLAQLVDRIHWLHVFSRRLADVGADELASNATKPQQPPRAHEQQHDRQPPIGRRRIVARERRRRASPLRVTAASGGGVGSLGVAYLTATLLQSHSGRRQVRSN